MSTNPGPTQPIKRSQPQATRPSSAPNVAATTPSAAPPPPPPPPSMPAKKGRGCLGGWLRSPFIVVSLLVLLGLLLVSTAGAAAGWSIGSSEFNATATLEAGLYMLDQYNLALADIDAGNPSLAQQRFEYIYSQNPNFLDVHDRLVNLMVAMNQTEQPEVLVPTATPTIDPRPKEELFTAAQALISSGDWTGAIDTLLALRQADPNYRIADVDGWMYAALRNRGAENIVQKGLFEPGLYDFSLAEAFGPLDGQAQNYREWARLYLYGNAFWLAYPQDAAYYYGQLVSLAPDLRDSNGVAAFTRYWQSLVRYADQLAADKQWCDAYDAYQAALNAANSGEIKATQDFTYIQCIGPSDTPTNTPINTATVLFSATATNTVAGPTSTPTNTPATPGTSGTPTYTPTASQTPTSSNTNIPAATATPTTPPTSTDTVAPVATDTPTP